MTEYVAIRMLRSSDVEDWLSSSLVIGAYVGGRIVGMIGLKRELGDKHEHKGFMWGFYVERDYRKQGVGRVLLTGVCDRDRPNAPCDRANSLPCYDANMRHSNYDNQKPNYRHSARRTWASAAAKIGRACSGGSLESRLGMRPR